jgi:uncharacterized protein (DUF1684 family)
MYRVTKTMVMIAFLMGFIADTAAQRNTSTYKNEILEWDKKRMESLKSATGWVNLSGLFWLKEGENKFGSADGNELVFKEKDFPAQLGTFLLKGNEVVWTTAGDHAVFVEREKIKTAIIFSGEEENAPQLAFQTFRWSVIKREDLIGIRFRDLASPLLEKLQHIPRYTIDQDWKINARIEKSALPSVSILNVLGQTTQEKSPGKVIFEFKGKSYSLDVVDEGTTNLFVLFGDETNAKDTYPTGRFLYIPRPDADGNTVIDFNKAFNPPCAFTPFATCPIPPKQNILPFAVKAGERKIHL